jgi:hypothetical protein
MEKESVLLLVAEWTNCAISLGCTAEDTTEHLASVHASQKQVDILNKTKLFGIRGRFLMGHVARSRRTDDGIANIWSESCRAIFSK